MSLLDNGAPVHESEPVKKELSSYTGRAIAAPSPRPDRSSPALGAGLTTREVGERLRTERGAARIGLRELARRIGITGSALSQIERGRVRPSIPTLIALCTELGLPLDDLLGLTPRRGGRAATRIARLGFRKTAEIRSGVRWSPVVGDDGSQLLQLELQPGAVAEAAGLPLRPEQHELFLFVTAGTLTVAAADAEHRISAGDSLVVAQRSLRSVANAEPEVARGVLAVVADER